MIGGSILASILLVGRLYVANAVVHIGEGRGTAIKVAGG